jgi:predicted kinase
MDCVSNLPAQATLLLLIGVPGCGKSMLAAQLQQQHSCLLISTDLIRERLFGDAAIQGAWRLIWQEVGQQLQAAVEQIHSGRAVFAIYDATNTRRRSRRQLIGLARSLGFTRVLALWLNPPLELCQQRNQQRQRQVPADVIQRMHQQLCSSPPRLREGIDLLLHYGTTAPNLEEVSQFLSGNMPPENNSEASTEIAAIDQQ